MTILARSRWIILHAVAALAKYQPPLIIVNLGTALVFDAARDYLGGAIAPGINIAAQALFNRAAMLRRVSIERPSTDSVIGKNTVHAIQSGFYGYADMIQGMVRRFRSEIGEDATIIATGGYAPILMDEIDCIDHVEPDLNLEGLRLVYEANR
ncbi:MAG: type III pantothenate kinase [Dehalococcoidia bacterium]